MDGPRVPALDGLRGIAVLLVLLIHFRIALGEGPIDHLVAFISSAGWLGVELFFVLSGFLITRLLLGTRGRPGYFRAFYARRTLRIFPLHYAVLGATVLLAPSLLASRELWYWLYLGNWDMGLHARYAGVLTGLWSLGVEEQFYLLWPILVLWLGSRRLVPACVLLGALSILLRAAALALGLDATAAYMLTPLHLDGLVVGSAIAALDDRGKLPTAKAALIIVTVAGLILLGCAAADGTAEWQPGPMALLGYSAGAALFGSVLVLVLRQPRTAALDQPWLRAVGRYSYAIYLLHPFVADRLTTLAFPIVLGSLVPSQVALYVVGASLSAAAGWASWNLLERHALALKRFVPYPKSAPLPDADDQHVGVCSGRRVATRREAIAIAVHLDLDRVVPR